MRGIVVQGWVLLEVDWSATVQAPSLSVYVELRQEEHDVAATHEVQNEPHTGVVVVVLIWLAGPNVVVLAASREIAMTMYE